MKKLKNVKNSNGKKRKKLIYKKPVDPIKLKIQNRKVKKEIIDKNKMKVKKKLTFKGTRKL